MSWPSLRQISLPFFNHRVNICAGHLLFALPGLLSIFLNSVFCQISSLHLEMVCKDHIKGQLYHVASGYSHANYLVSKAFQKASLAFCSMCSLHNFNKFPFLLKSVSVVLIPITPINTNLIY